MHKRDLLYLVISNLKRMKMRVAMAAAGVLTGTLAIVLLVAFGLGLQRNFRESILGMQDLTTFMVTPAIDAEQSHGGSVAAPGKPAMSLTPSVIERIRQLPGVQAVTPYQHIGVSAVAKYRNLEFNLNLTGIDPDELEGLGFELQSGEARLGSGQVFIGASVGNYAWDPRQRAEASISSTDLQDQWLEVVLTRYADEAGVGLQGAVEETRTIRLHVAGVLAKSGGALDSSVFMALQDVESVIAWDQGKRPDRMREGYSSLSVKASDPASALTIDQAVTEMGGRVLSARTYIEEMSQLFGMIQMILAIIGAVSLLVSAFSIANTMIMAIYERTSEIGLLKSLGATNSDVLFIFLGEAAGIGFLGGASGTTASFLLGKAIETLGGGYLLAQNALLQMPLRGGQGSSVLYLPLWLLGFGLFFSLAVGTLSGVYPALRAASLDPLDALRNER
jgi:putative ABC transport system permease protein